jgi:hypothetical protein
MTPPGGKLKALACHPTKKVIKAEELNYLYTNIDSVLNPKILHLDFKLLWQRFERTSLLFKSVSYKNERLITLVLDRPLLKIPSIPRHCGYTLFVAVINSLL